MRHEGRVAAILGAIRALGASGDLERLDGELIVALVPSEEDGGQGTLAAIRAGVRGDLAIITEPTDLDVVVAHAGAITFRLTVPGRAAHASQRREGVSALDKLFVLSRALEADEARRNAAETDPLMTALGLPYPTIIGIVAGGEWASTVLDRVTADGRYGVRLGQTPTDAEAELRAVIASACAADEFLREHPANIEITGGRFGSARVASDHPLPVRLAEVVESVTGRRPGVARRALRRRHADVRQRRRDALRDVRPGQRQGRAQRGRARPARPGRGLRAGIGGVGAARADRSGLAHASRRDLSVGHLDEPAEGIDHAHLFRGPAAGLEQRRAMRPTRPGSARARSRR